MTEIATREAGTPAVATAPSDLQAWAQSAREAASVAVSLAKTPFVPQSLRDRSDDSITVGNITAAILTGQEVGLQPMAALRALDVIQGTPAFRAITLRALVLSHGHDMWLVESTATRAIVRGRRAGSSETQESTWTLDRARALALLGKDNWKKQPGAMLVARATSECARLVAPDVIMGVPYSVEELEDGDTTDAPTTATAPTSRRTAQRRTAPPAAPAVRTTAPAADAPADPEPDFEPSGLDEFAAETTSNRDDGTEPASDAPVGLSTAQRTKLHAVFGDLKIILRDDKIRIIAALIGRTVASSNDLTKVEATRLIDQLETIINQENPFEHLAAVIEMAEADREASEQS